jgi:ElaB/YqjD/DUF883 family membrane-anchored ribosome-binding protein
MAEERSTMNPLPAAAAPGVPGPQASEADDTQELRAQIERTREDMGRTIDELQERLSPQNVVQQAKDSVHEATVGRLKNMVSDAGETVRETAVDVAERAQDTAGTVVDEVRAHPVTTALIGAGVVWLLSGTSIFQRRSGQRYGARGNGTPAYRSTNFQEDNDMRYDARQGGWTDVLRDHPVPTALAALGIGYLLMQRDSGGRSREPWRAAGDTSRRYRSDAWAEDYRGETQSRPVGGMAYEAGSGARQSDMGEKVSEWSEQVGDGVRRASATVRESAGELTGNVQERWQTMRRRTSSEFEEWMEDNPLAVGAAALAAGLAIGFTTPRTQFEDEKMGAARDALVARTSGAAEGAAQQVAERVKTAASELMGDDAQSPQSPNPSTSPGASMTDQPSQPRGMGNPTSL